MEKEFPMTFELDSKTHVTVNRTATHQYDFLLRPEDGPEERFAYNDEEEFTDEKEKAMPFEQLNALRRFWLETRNED